MMSLKRVLVLLVLTLVSGSVLYAQKERNYIYILDCSNSMEDLHIWDKTLDFIGEDIARMTPRSRVTIIPFQGGVIEKCVVSEGRSTFDWPAFREKVYPEVKHLTGTNICDAWDRALTYLDPNKDNYVYLMTDGEDNKKGTNEVCRRIRQWCSVMRNAQGYYVMLAKEAKNASILQAISECQNFEVVYSPKNPFGSFHKTQINYNTKDQIQPTLLFSAEGQFKCSVICNDPSFQVRLKDNIIDNGMAHFEVSVSVDSDTLQETSVVELSVISDEVEIKNPNLTLVVKNEEEKMLSLPKYELDFGKSEWYDSFLWEDAQVPETLFVDLRPVFNDAALRERATVSLLFEETTTDVKGHALGLESELFFNGHRIENGKLKLGSNVPGVLSIVPHTDSEEGMHYYKIRVVPHSRRHLDAINQQPPLDYELTLRSEYVVVMNPLKIVCIWFVIILAILLALWFIIFRPLFFPKIRKIHKLQVSHADVFYIKKVNGYRKVIFTNRSGREPGIISKIFFGDVLVVKSPSWDQDWELIPASKGARILLNGNYVADPYVSVLTPQAEIKLTSCATSETADIVVLN